MQARTDSLPSQNHHEDWSGQGELNPRLITRPSVNRSALFTTFNALKGLNTVEPKRLNRALGLAQRRNPETKYVTTTTSCTCPDAKYRRVVCKHIASLILKEVSS